MLGGPVLGGGHCHSAAAAPCPADGPLWHELLGAAPGPAWPAAGCPTRPQHLALGGVVGAQDEVLARAAQLQRHERRRIRSISYTVDRTSGMAHTSANPTSAPGPTPPPRCAHGPRFSKAITEGASSPHRGGLPPLVTMLCLPMCQTCIQL